MGLNVVGGRTALCSLHIQLVQKRANELRWGTKMQMQAQEDDNPQHACPAVVPSPLN